MSTWIWFLRRQGDERQDGRLRMRAWLPLAATAAAMLPAVVPVSPVAAAPPANDDIANAVLISGAGFSATADTREATYAVTDDGCGVATVWYVFTPAADGRYLFENTGSSYDTRLALHSGSPGALQQLTCHDDDVGRNERIIRNLVAGTTYYIEAGTCCWDDSETGQVGPGGDLVFKVSVPPPKMRAASTVGSRATLTKFGGFRIQGSARCRPDATSARVSVSVRQQQGNDVINAGRSRRVQCTNDRHSWGLLVENRTRAFVAKPIQVRWRIRACDDFTCDRDGGRRIVRVR
jgi:hypothetical protein